MNQFYLFMKKEEEDSSLFMNYEWHEKHGVPVCADRYNMVYGGFFNEDDTVMEALENIYCRFNMGKPSDYRNRSVSVSDVIVLADNDGTHAYFVDSFGFTEVAGFLAGWRGDIAVKIADRYISIKECTEGYDYSIYDEKYRLLDGGVYDDYSVSGMSVLYEVITSELFGGQMSPWKRILMGTTDGSSGILRISAEELEENIMEQPVSAQELLWEQNLEDFKRQRDKAFHPIDNHTEPESLETLAYDLAEELLEDTGINITGVLLAGSLARGEERPDSDIDFLLSYEGDLKEFAVFNILHAKEYCIDGRVVDFNPVRPDESGTLASYVAENF